MPAPTNTFTTAEAVGNREDLSDIIYRTSPTETPFVSGIAKVKATAVSHDWQKQALRPASTSNAVSEGSDAVINVRTPTVRLSNIAQIQDETAQVSGTQQAVKTAGRDDEMDYQVILAGLELKRDMEATALNNQAKSSGDPRYMAGILSWIKTNTDFEAGAGADPSTSDGLGTRTDSSSPRAFTEDALKTVLNSVWSNSSQMADTIMLGGFNKQVMSGFVGRGTPTEDTKAKKIVAAVDVYESDFGTLKIVPNRFQRARDALILRMDKWAVATLRNMKTDELAKTGDSRKKQIVTEWTLEARNEESSGGVFDLTTS